MKYALLIPILATVVSTHCFSQDRIYRCGNEYTNTVSPAQARGCKLIEGGNVTVVQAVRPPNNTASARPGNAASSSAATPSASGGPRVEANEQKSRDSDARQILDSELKKAEARRTELLKEYNNGQPSKHADEVNNPQKYLDRIAELKASLARYESDIAGIRRELGRFGATAAK